jgi:SAM-dependent methyltransferase
MSITKLNLGCGNDIREGWVNMDHIHLPGVDTVHDVNKLPLPFNSDFFDEILARDILEHVNLVDVMNDLYRILKPGGLLKIRVPHFSSYNNFIDPTHKNRFSFLTFDFFCKGGYFKRDYYFENLFSTVESVKISFAKHPLYFYNYFLEPIFNISGFMRSFYEQTMFSRLFPAENILVTLKK